MHVCFLRGKRKGVSLRGNLEGFGGGKTVTRIYYMKKNLLSNKEGEREKQKKEDTVGLEKQDSNYQSTTFLSESRCSSQCVSSSGMGGVDGSDGWQS